MKLHVIATYRSLVRVLNHVGVESNEHAARYVERGMKLLTLWHNESTTNVKSKLSQCQRNTRCRTYLTRVALTRWLLRYEEMSKSKMFRQLWRTARSYKALQYTTVCHQWNPLVLTAAKHAHISFLCYRYK